MYFIIEMDMSNLSLGGGGKKEGHVELHVAWGLKLKVKGTMVKARERTVWLTGETQEKWKLRR